jgi:hypothetical protein
LTTEFQNFFDNQINEFLIKMAVQLIKND